MCLCRYVSVHGKRLKVDVLQDKLPLVRVGLEEFKNIRAILCSFLVESASVYLLPSVIILSNVTYSSTKKPYLLVDTPPPDNA